MRETVDSKTGAILFKEDYSDIRVKELTRKVGSLEREITMLKIKINKLLELLNIKETEV